MVRCVQPLGLQPLRFVLVFLLGVLALGLSLGLIAGFALTGPLQAPSDILSAGMNMP